MVQRITIMKVRHADFADINQQLQWLGNSLGLFNSRDKDSSCFRVFITVVRRSLRNQPASSDEIAQQLHLSRGTVVHHLIRLMDSGIVIRERERYLLRENHLEQVITGLQQEIDSALQEVQEIAKKIDEQLG